MLREPKSVTARPVTAAAPTGLGNKGKVRMTLTTDAGDERLSGSPALLRGPWTLTHGPQPVDAGSSDRPGLGVSEEV